MAKPELVGFNEAVPQRAAPKAAQPTKPRADSDTAMGRSALTGQFATRHWAVMVAAERSGFTTAKDGRIAGRVSRKLIEAAKARTGIETDTDLLQFALASLALEDDFATTFAMVRATVDPELDLGY